MNQSLPWMFRIMWVLRIVWALSPIALGRLAGDVLSSTSSGFENTFLIGLWVLWGVGVACTFFLHAVSLTLLRSIIPIGLAVAVWGSIQSAEIIESIVGIAQMSIAVLLGFSASLGYVFINRTNIKPSCPNNATAERRLLLKPPLLIQFGFAPVVWIATASGLVSGPLLLASDQWIVGGIVLPLGAGVALFGFRSIHSLVWRQVIFVPTGIVLLDSLHFEGPLRIEQDQIQGHLVLASLGERKQKTLDLASATLGKTIEIAIKPAVHVKPLKQTAAVGQASEAGFRFVRLSPTLLGNAHQELDKYLR